MRLGGSRPPARAGRLCCAAEFDRIAPAAAMSHLLQVLLLLALIVPAAKLAAAAANRFGQPAVFGEMLAGLILGPTVLDILGWPAFVPVDAPLHHAAVEESLLGFVRSVADIGVILLMFIAGLETHVAEMRRVGRVAFWAAFGGVILPLAGGAATAALFGYPLLFVGVFIGTILTATSVSISAQTLMELGALRSREGSTILGAAIVDDVMGILLLSVVVALARAHGSLDPAAVALIVARMVLFFAAAVYLGRLLGSVAGWADRLAVNQGLLAVVLAVAFLYAWAAEYLGGVAAITGSYMAGVLFAQTPFKSTINRGIHPLTYTIFVPVFFISIGLQANARELGGGWLFTITLIVVAIVTKVLGCATCARVAGFSGREAVRVGVGMISRGEVGLIVAGYGLAARIIPSDVFSAAVLVVLGTTMVTPPLLRLVFPRTAPAETGRLEESVANPPEAEDVEVT
jgi:Kef-type K+ transport system membrane component KefB